MFFRAQNLGPLRDAEIDLSKDLIVLAGPNNSGKTYLAWSVYGLHRCELRAEDLSEAWAKQLLESPTYSVGIDDLLAENGPAVLASIAGQCRTKLHLCFATEGDRFAKTDLSLRQDRVDTSSRQGWLHSFDSHQVQGTFTDRSGGVHLILADADTYRRVILPTQREDRYVPANWQAATRARFTLLSDEQRQQLLRYTGLQLVTLIPRALFPNCTLFPAERLAVNIFAKELALTRNALIDEMVDADLDNQPGRPIELIRGRTGRYPWPIRDSLKVANDLAMLRKRGSAFADLADELEQAILGGAVTVSDLGELLFSPQAVPDARLAIHLTASVVKSLTSLVFYFRHLAEKGDFLIIDEPELNLHPDNQRKIARILAKAVRRGFKVMISTHSDYVLRELNHLIMLNKLPAEEARELGYDPEFALDPAKVGVYLVDDHHTESIPIEATGFSIKTIDAVVNQLNIDEQRLHARLTD